MYRLIHLQRSFQRIDQTSQSIFEHHGHPLQSVDRQQCRQIGRLQIEDFEVYNTRFVYCWSIITNIWLLTILEKEILLDYYLNWTESIFICNQVTKVNFNTDLHNTNNKDYQTVVHRFAKIVVIVGIHLDSWLPRPRIASYKKIMTRKKLNLLTRLHTYCWVSITR